MLYTLLTPKNPDVNVPETFPLYVWAVRTGSLEEAPSKSVSVFLLQLEPLKLPLDTPPLSARKGLKIVWRSLCESALKIGEMPVKKQGEGLWGWPGFFLGCRYLVRVHVTWVEWRGWNYHFTLYFPSNLFSIPEIFLLIKIPCMESPLVRKFFQLIFFVWTLFGLKIPLRYDFFLWLSIFVVVAICLNRSHFKNIRNKWKFPTEKSLYQNCRSSQSSGTPRRLSFQTD